MEIGGTMNDTFYLEDYNKYYNYATANNLTIIEIEADENGRRFKLVENKPTLTQMYTNEITSIKNWFNDYYTIHEQKYRRLYTLKLDCDDGAAPYDKLLVLYNDAEIKRARIQELERLLSDNSK